MFRTAERRTEAVPLFGREDSTAVLDGALAALRAGVGGCVVVEGTAGVGKTRFVEHVADRAEAGGIRVARGRATELDSLLPLAALRGMFRTDRDAGVDHATRFPWSAEHPFSVVEGLTARIELWAGDGPALVVLDDAHRADDLTALVLRAVVPDTGSRSVLWLLTRRPMSGAAGATATLDLLLRQGAALHGLAPLPPGVIARMCAHLLGAEPDPDVLRLADRCEGSPFLLEKLLTAGRRARLVRIEDGRAVIAEHGLPGDFVTAVEQHLAPLSAETRRMLAVASVLDRPFTVHEVGRLTGRAIPELVPVTTEAIHASVLVSNGVRLSFRHGLVREALYAALPGAVRSALHREAATLGRGEGEAHRHTGSTVDLDRVRQLRQGLDDPPGRADGTVDPAWASLTRAELRVVRLVAQGLTNREVADRLYLSRHTVDSHLRHSFTKLGVGNRVELTRLAMGRDTRDRDSG